ncbi:MAG: hypothetical protein NTY63_08690 [Candidatus Bipolaricaulota bacterium]|nr:hypothetical protein [Candidatus Bipolaricaulota bacterium]
MVRQWGIALCLMMAVGIPVVAFEMEGGLSAFYAPFAYANGLLAAYEEEAGATIPDLGLGIGGDFRMPIASFSDRLRGGVGGRVLGARVSERETDAAASLVGGYAWCEYRLGSWRFQTDLGVYRGTFDFAEARYAGLGGWGLGVAGRAGYRVPLGKRLSLGVAAGLEWLPVWEMTDASGQTYRGRGTPFVDFSGVSVSIELSWSSGKGVGE